MRCGSDDSGRVVGKPHLTELGKVYPFNIRLRGYRVKYLADQCHIHAATCLRMLCLSRAKALLGSAVGMANRNVASWSLSGTMTWESGLAFSPSYANCGGDRDTVPVDRILSDRFTSREVGTATSRPQVACLFS